MAVGVRLVVFDGGWRWNVEPTQVLIWCNAGWLFLVAAQMEPTVKRGLMELTLVGRSFWWLRLSRWKSLLMMVEVLPRVRSSRVRSWSSAVSTKGGCLGLLAWLRRGIELIIMVVQLLGRLRRVFRA